MTNIHTNITFSGELHHPEIDRLRAEIERLRKKLTLWGNAIKHAQDNEREIERLRAALEMISSGWETPPMECMTSRSLARFMWKTATTALAQEKTND